jgi:RNA polymerase sigma-70 factor (ECF subfamily)
MDDIELLQKIAKGDSKAFESLLHKYQRSVYGLSLRMLKSSSLAEDNAQETWIRVVKASGQFENKGSVIGWILTITKNLALNSIEKRGWEEALSPEEENQVMADQKDLEIELSHGETLQKLKKAVAQLPDRQRIALVLWMEQEKSYSELAQEMNLNVNAIKVLLFRAKENVQKFMKEDS